MYDVLILEIDAEAVVIPTGDGRLADRGTLNERPNLREERRPVSDRFWVNPEILAIAMKEPKLTLQFPGRSLNTARCLCVSKSSLREAVDSDIRLLPF